MKKEISDKTCSYYDLMENYFSCGPEGYAKAYGGKYCNEYLKKRDEFENK